MNGDGTLESFASVSGICRAEAQQVPVLAAALARAFHEDPVHRFLFAGEARMNRHHTDFFVHLLNHYLRHFVVLTTPDLEGAAMWEPPGAHPPGLAQLGLMWRIGRLLGWRSVRIGVSFSELPRLRPAEPHWYLAVLGTDPARTGRGVGGRLLRAVLDRCKAERVPGYLEASREENVPYYQRFGFEVVAPYTLAGGPTVWRMKYDV